MSKFIDLTGEKFGRLTVIKRKGYSKSKKTQWLCKCDCGNFKIINGSDLKSNKTRSCGCLRKEKAIIVAKSTNLKHNMTHSRPYRIWSSIKSRCYYKNNIAFKNYGGRGIKICDEWRNNFEKFYEWAIENGYKDNLTIDRINNDGDYEPSNCRWISMQKQENNRRNNRIIIYKSQKYTLAELSNLLKIPSATLSWRINNNWKEEELTLPVNLSNRVIRKEKKYESV